MNAPFAAARSGLYSQGTTGHAVRQAARSGTLTGDTSGMAPGFVQGNLAILPREYADEFLRFCQANPKPCPLIGISEPGDPAIPSLAADLDIRTDLPSYRVWENGEMVAEVSDVRDYWRDDLVTFVLGCSYSFEEALLQDGLPIHHIENDRVAAVFRTNVPCQPAGRFAGPLVVSMRSFVPAQAIRAIQITTRFPSVHGAPVHIGMPEALGIADIAKPDYGESNPPLDGEIPVFWACGVTPQAVIAQAKPSFAITHSPGSMLVTDRRNTELAIL